MRRGKATYGTANATANAIVNVSNEITVLNMLFSQPCTMIIHIEGITIACHPAISGS